MVKKVCDFPAWPGSVIETLRLRALQQPDCLGYGFLSQRGEHTESLTYGALDRKARGIGGYLQARTRPGDRVILFFPPGLDYVAAF